MFSPPVSFPGPAPVHFFNLRGAGVFAVPTRADEGHVCSRPPRGRALTSPLPFSLKIPPSHVNRRQRRKGPLPLESARIDSLFFFLSNFEFLSL